MVIETVIHLFVCSCIYFRYINNACRFAMLIDWLTDWLIEEYYFSSKPWKICLKKYLRLAFVVVYFSANKLLGEKLSQEPAASGHVMMSYQTQYRTIVKTVCDFLGQNVSYSHHTSEFIYRAWVKEGMHQHKNCYVLRTSKPAHWHSVPWSRQTKSLQNDIRCSSVLFAPLHCCML